jgi:hypothetical protein
VEEDVGVTSVGHERMFSWPGAAALRCRLLTPIAISKMLARRGRITRQGLTVGLTVVVLVPLLTACGGMGGGEARDVPLHEDFSECEGYSLSDEIATVDCPDGELRILVAKPELSPSHFVPFRFDTKQQTLVVSATARAPVAGGAWGIGCLTSERGAAGQGYAFLVTDRGEAAIMRFDPAGEESDGRSPQEFTLLGGREDVVQNPSARHLLRVRCAKAATGAVRVGVSVDGGDPLTAEDTHGMGPFTAGFSIVLTDKPGTELHFDDVNIDGTPVIQRGPALSDQEGRIALVRTAAGKQTANGRVTSVFCQSENSGCVVTFKVEYSAPDCQFWVVESVNGVDIAKPDGPLSEGHGTYDEDNPDAIGCDYGQ